MKATYPLTSKGQITVPKEVREHLGLKPGSHAYYRIKKNGEVTIDSPPGPGEIMAKIGPPSGKQPLTEFQKQRGEYLAKKYNVKL